MFSLSRTVKLLTLALSLTLAFGVMPVFARLELIVNGKANSPGLRINDGNPDVMPVQRLGGKIGEVLSDGRWRFQVLSVQSPESYAMMTDAEPYDYGNLSSFDLTRRIFTPKAGYKLVVIQCRATNAQKSQKRLWVAASDRRNVRTALTDMGGISHTPIGYDFEGGPIQTKPLLPDETIIFPVIFSVPQSAQLKELIFTLAANGERETSKDARISLIEGAGEPEMNKEGTVEKTPAEILSAQTTKGTATLKNTPGNLLVLPASGSLVIEMKDGSTQEVFLKGVKRVIVKP